MHYIICPVVRVSENISRVDKLNRNDEHPRHSVVGARKLFGASVALWRGFEADTGADIQKPLRYEDYLRMHLDGDTDFSALKKESVISQEAVPKSKEQIISELAPKISKPGITPGRATIEAQRLYADAERIFGSNADTVLEMFQPGQDPRKFLDGLRIAPIPDPLFEAAPAGSFRSVAAKGGS